MRAVKRTMRRLPEHERQQGMDLAEGAEQTFVTIGAPSRLGCGLAAVLAKSSGATEDSPVHTEIIFCTLMGYAARMSQNRDAPSDVAGKIEPNLLRDEEGQVDFEALEGDPQRFRLLSEWIINVAADPLSLMALSSCNPGAWESFSATTSFALQRNLLDNGLQKNLLIPAKGMDELLRLGYAIRVVDEVAGLDPLPKPER